MVIIKHKTHRNFKEENGEYVKLTMEEKIDFIYEHIHSKNEYMIEAYMTATENGRDDGSR